MKIIRTAKDVQLDNSSEYDVEEMEQEYTSEKTSINSRKLPAIFHLVNFKPDTINLDYGGGKFDNAADYLETQGVTNLVYDPYNRSAAHNKEVIRMIRENGGADTATLSNVLNVIKEPEVRLNVLRNIRRLLKPNGTVYITVYEGSGQGVEGPTKSGYQLNKKTADYLEEIQQVFPDAERRGKMIIGHTGGSVKSAVSIPAKPVFSDWNDYYGLQPPEEYIDIEEGDEFEFDIPVDTQIQVHGISVQYVPGTTNWANQEWEQYIYGEYYTIATPDDIKDLVFDIFEEHGLFPESDGVYHIMCDIHVSGQCWGWYYSKLRRQIELGDLEVDWNIPNVKISNYQVERVD